MSAMRTVTVVVSALVLVVSSCGGTESQPAEAPLDTSEPWDLVWISDSMGSRVAEAWADRIEESEAVEVRVHNHIIGSMTIEEAQEMITNEAAIRAEVAGAEIIVVYGNASYSAPNDMETCARSGADPRDPPERSTSASFAPDFAPYGDVFRDVFDTVFELRASQPTVIRTYDQFSGSLADWREAGIEPECTAGWEAQADAIHEAADEYGVLTASFYDEFNGTKHDEDPRAKGYILRDGWHPSPEGTTTQVEVLHALGYDPITPWASADKTTPPGAWRSLIV